MSYLNGLTVAFGERLKNNMIAGFELVNSDYGIEKSLTTNHLEQFTSLGLRRQIAADSKRCIRQYFIHTISIKVSNSDNSARRDILTTASELQTLFEKKEFDAYKTQTAEIDIVGKQANSKFYRVDVNVNGYFEEAL